MDVNFRIGDKAVYPARGVVEVTGLEIKEISGLKTQFYILQTIANGDSKPQKIMVPVSNAATVGLRTIMTKQEVKDVYDILKSRGVAVEGQTWNRRYREYMEKIKTGSVFEVAEVLRDLSRLKADKELSFGEKQMLDQAKTLLICELAIARSAKEDKIRKEIEAIFTSN